MTKKKFNVFLDLDQTLISAEANDEFDFNNSKEKSKKLRLMIWMGIILCLKDLDYRIFRLFICQF